LIKEAELFANSHLPVVELVDSACSWTSGPVDELGCISGLVDE
jgi:hypothetical protein